MLVFWLMILAHMIADYSLQGWLANGKQRKWWVDQVKSFNGEDLDKTKYKNDYKCALLCHALYWSILVCLPLYWSPWFSAFVVGNTVVHYIVDDLKANKFKLNLIEDQVLHFLQILATFLVALFF